jgi:hypothetical protein
MKHNAPAFISFFLTLPLCAQVTVRHSIDRISVEIDKKPFTDFFIGADLTKPFLHPIRAASGTIVTRLFPMELVEGESTDHPHQRGLWFSHGDVNGVDFWSNEASYTTPNRGIIAIRRILDLQDGKKKGVVTTTFGWLDPKGNTLLDELRTMTFYADPKFRVIDFDITLTAVQEVKFGDTKEGTFAIRLAPGLEEPHKGAPANPPRTGRMVNSEGQQTEAQVWGKRAKWVDYFGEIRGEKLGVAIFDHPSNPRHPTYWHVRSYGLFAANIFGLHDFLHDNSKDGSMILQPGHSVRFRYRVMIHPGDYQSAGIEALYQKYAAMK